MINPPHLALQNYLATEVHTATPQKLQLMLIDGALRFGQKGRALWHSGQGDAAGEAIIRCQQIVAQLLAGLNRDGQPELARKISSVYLFVLNSLIAAYVNRDEQKLDDALTVLAEERITWQALCQQLGARAAEPASHLALEA